MALAVLAPALAALGAAPARADQWGVPFRVAGPMSVDLLPSQVGFAPGGAATIGFSAQDEDAPAQAQAFAVTRSQRGRLSRPSRVGGAQQVIDLGFDGRSLDVLAGASPRGQACCSSVQLRLGSGRPRTLIDTLAGATVGRLLILPRHTLLAAIATARGVWVSQPAGARPARLTPASAEPQTFAAATLPRGRSAVAWTATDGQAGAPSPRSIIVAQGSATKPPGSPRVALTVAPGHWIDELQMAGPTLAWVESWYDGSGAFHSQIAVGDLGISRTVRPRAFPLAGGGAGLSFAGDSRGDLVAAWKTCDALGNCSVQAVSRPAGGRFGSVQTLGSIDASESPAAAARPGGEALVAWVAQGHVVAADRPRSGAAFAAPRLVSATSYAADLTLTFAPDGAALAIWTQGTVATSVMGAVHRAG